MCEKAQRRVANGKISDQVSFYVVNFRRKCLLNLIRQRKYNLPESVTEDTYTTR